MRYRGGQHYDAKRAIAEARRRARAGRRHARSGSTAVRPPPRSPARWRRAPGLRVVTNALNIASELAVRSNIELVVCGGSARAESYELVGPLAELTLVEHQPRHRDHRRRRRQRERRLHDPPRGRGAHQPRAGARRRTRHRRRRLEQDRQARLRQDRRHRDGVGHRHRLAGAARRTSPNCERLGPTRARRPAGLARLGQRRRLGQQRRRAPRPCRRRAAQMSSTDSVAAVFGSHIIACRT